LGVIHGIQFINLPVFLSALGYLRVLPDQRKLSDLFFVICQLVFLRVGRAQVCPDYAFIDSY
jgi:hypothetical protein